MPEQIIECKSEARFLYKTMISMSSYLNKTLIGEVLPVLIEKISKKSERQWAGRTESNVWVVFDKKNENIKDIVQVKIIDAKGVTLFGESISNKEFSYEIN